MIVKKAILIFSISSFILISFVYYYLNTLPDVSLLATNYPTLTMSSQGSKRILKLSRSLPWHWYTLEQIAPEAVAAVVVSEDWAFFMHMGFDLGQIKDALWDALRGKRFRGASTITQQLVKNLYLTSEKSLSRKVQELILSLKIEEALSKKRILELYLNVIEFGGGLYGVGSAADHYFRKSPATLTIKESAFLAMILPNPRIYSQSFRDRKMSDYAKKTIEAIINKMKQAKYISAQERNLALKQRFTWDTDDLGIMFATPSDDEYMQTQ